MKSFSNILATTIVALFLLSFGMKSEAEGQVPTECESDPCYQEQDWFADSKRYPVGPQPACSDCWVEIHYKTRNNSTNPNCQSLPPFEIQLDFIVVSGSCYYSPCSFYTPFEMKSAYQYAMTRLLLDLGFTPPTNGCSPILEGFTIINCFREDLDLEGNRIFRYCAKYTCCKMDLKLCEENGKIEIYSNVTASTGDCSNDPQFPDECKTVCDWIEEAILPKKILEDNSKGEINSLKVFPNPINNNKLSFTLDNNVGIENISILTNDGKLIEISKNNLINGNQIDIENYSNGYYILIIKGLDGKSYYNQFLINK